jgi:hypothetical protein
MTGGVPDVLFDEVLFEGGGEVYTGLVGNANEDPEGVGEFVAEFSACVRWFEGLVTVKSAHEAGHFPHFFGKDSHVGELAEIADPGRADPVVDQLLGFADGYLICWGAGLIVVALHCSKYRIRTISWLYFVGQ